MASMAGAWFIQTPTAVPPPRRSCMPACCGYRGWARKVQLFTEQFADTPTRGLPTRGLDISQTGQLAE